MISLSYKKCDQIEFDYPSLWKCQSGPDDRLTNPPSNKWVTCESMWPFFTDLVLMAALHKKKKKKIRAARRRDCARSIHSINLDSTHETRFDWLTAWVARNQMLHVPTTAHLLQPSQRAHLEGMKVKVCLVKSLKWKIFNISSILMTKIQCYLTSA